MTWNFVSQVTCLFKKGVLRRQAGEQGFVLGLGAGFELVWRWVVPPRAKPTQNQLESHAIFAPWKEIQGSLVFWIPRRLFRITGTGFQSSDSTSKISRIPDSTSLRVAAPSPISPFFLCRGEGVATRRLGFHELKFLRFRNLDSLTRGPTIQRHLH